MRAARLRPAEARSALALLGQALSGDGLTLACPSPGGTAGGMGASFRLDGSATLRFTAVEALAASGGTEALARLGDRMSAARGALASIRAAIDALVGLLALAAGLGTALDTLAHGGSGRTAVLHAMLVAAAYAALAPCRGVLLRLAIRTLTRAALRRIAP